LYKYLVGEGETTHTRLDAEHVVVGGEHVHSGSIVGGLHSDSNLGIVNAGEVASAGGLVLLGLKSK